MKFGKADFPHDLLDDLHNNKVVVFAGAGVSMGKPACLPNFESLTKMIAKGAGESKSKSENNEQFLGRLYDRDVKVHQLAKNELSRKGLKPTPLHRDLLKLYRKDQSIRLVTTNFDLLFEQSAQSMYDTTPEVFHAPMLPFGHQLNGIVHIHGSITYPDQMILTDRDFGRAYLREASVTRFLLDLYDKYTFLFVGYSHSDTVVNYLVRSLPAKASLSLYALIPDSEDADHRHWDHLGINKIPYPNHDNDHRELNEAITKLAILVQRRMVDWRRDISVIAEKQPNDLDKEAMELIDYALKDKIKAEFFTKSASHPEWIDWLDKRGHLTPLFGNGILLDSHKILAFWLADRFLKDHSHSLFLLICRHNMPLNPTLWNYIAQKIGRDDGSSLDTTILSRWTTLLLSTAPAEGETPDGGHVYTSNCLTEIARRCSAHEMVNEVLLIFGAMIRTSASITESQYRPLDETDMDLQLSLKIRMVGKSDDLDILWKEGMKPLLPTIAQPLLERAIHCLKMQYTFYETWGRATPSSDPVSPMRSAIEPHEQDEQRGRNETDVLIDAARDCLDWLAPHKPDVAAQWCSRLVASDPPLLRRLAVHSLSQRTDLTPDGNIQWLLEHVDVHDNTIHHEVYQAVRQAYPEASADCRMAFIERVQSYRFPHEENPYIEEITARAHFHWFDWLRRADSACSLVKQALDNVMMQYPDFKPKDHPDFTSWIESGWIGPSRVPSVDELLEKSPSYWPDRLLSIEGAEEQGPTRAGLIQNLSDATRRDFDWSLGMASALGASGKWDVYPWSALINSWLQMDLEEDQYLRVFAWLENTQLYPKHNREIADALYALVKKGGPSYALPLLPKANRIAEELWNHLDRNVSVDEKHGWFNQSAKYPVWGLVNFWLNSFSLWRQHEASAPTALSEDYRRPLMEIIKDASPIGALGKSILASQLRYLLGADEEWTRKHFLPLFELDSTDFQAVWDGFVATGSLSPPVVEALKELFLKAVTRINTELRYQRRGFVECYTVMLIYAVDDVLDTWIPELFAFGSQQSQQANREPTLVRDDSSTIPEIVALKVCKCLQHMSASQSQELWERWLKEYWQNRIYGIPPVPFTATEAGIMLQWLPELKKGFPEAVDLAIQMQTPSLQHTTIFASLITAKTWQVYPEAVAKLLIYLWGCNIPVWHRHSLPQIITPLLKADISRERRQKLEDIKIQLPPR